MAIDLGKESERSSYEQHFQEVIDGIPGASAVIVADRDGVSIISVGDIPDEHEAAVRATAFSVSADQASKLRLGNCKTIVNMFSDYIVVHINHLPLVISIFGTSECNVGLILDIADEIKSSLDPLRIKLAASLDLQ